MENESHVMEKERNNIIILWHHFPCFFKGTSALEVVNLLHWVVNPPNPKTNIKFLIFGQNQQINGQHCFPWKDLSICEIRFWFWLIFLTVVINISLFPLRTKKISNPHNLKVYFLAFKFNKWIVHFIRLKNRFHLTSLACWFGGYLVLL